ncbi:MAG: HAMP domain-containing histidine kinase, partial [Erysipelotrichia bacterium]|nr:HAMP domain-containing histidine kinase [Erysipelotrichia bacterium]
GLYIILRNKHTNLRVSTSSTFLIILTIITTLIATYFDIELAFKLFQTSVINTFIVLVGGNIKSNQELFDSFYLFSATFIIFNTINAALGYGFTQYNTRFFGTTIHPNFDDDGNIISYDAINEDITFQKELKNQQNLLVEQSKSAALGEMISMIAHQWRQPLQAVSILIQKLPLLKEIQGEITDEILNDVVLQVTKQLDYMSKTIDDFKDYFKPNKKKEEVYIENVINKSMDFLSYLFKINSIKVEYKNESTSLIEIFLNEMVQVFINLAKNSCDAMIEKNIEKRVIKIYSYEKDNNLYVELEDNAGGINPKVIDKIFDPYFSTKTNKNGTGLGLYMSKTIIEQHSLGKISVCNSDVGAKFIIELPLNRS